MSISSPEASSSAPVGFSPIDAALAVAREEIEAFFTADVPFGAEDEVLNQATRLGQELDQVRVTMAVRLAQLESSGALLERGGQRTLTAWMKHSFGMGRTEAENLARLARAFHSEGLPETAQEFQAGRLSLGEASAIARAAERETAKRDAAEYPDAGEFGRMIETGLVAYKREVPQASVVGLERLALRLGHRLNPGRLDQQDKQAEADRGAVLDETLNGVFVFRAWGSAADAEMLKAVLEAYAPPYSSSSSEDGTSSSRQERTYDAFTNAMAFAHGHQECPDQPGPTALINITVPISTLIGQEGEDPAQADTGSAMATARVRAMLGENLVRYFLTDEDGNTAKVSNRQRIIPDKVRAAAFAGHTTCAWAQGCDVPVRYAQADHKVEFHRGGTSTPENIQPLCSMHNRLKHRLQTEEDRRFWKGRPGTSPKPQDPDPYPEKQKQPKKPQKKDPPPSGGGESRRP